MAALARWCYVRAMGEVAKRPRVLLRLAISLAIAVALAWTLVSGGLPIIPAAQAFDHVQWWMVGLYCLSLVGVHLVRAIRWRHLLRPLGEVPARHVLSTAWIGFAAVLLMPLRAGEVVRPYLVTKRGTVKGWEAAGSVGAERVIDGVVLSVLLFLALQLTTPLSPLPDRVGDLMVPVATIPSAAYGALVLFLVAFSLMALFYFKRAWGVRLARATFGVVSTRLADRVAGVVERVASGMAFLPSGRHMVPFLFETLCYWALNALGFWLLARGCGLESIGVWEACVVMGCLGIGILVPSGPGYFGTYQLSVYLALAMFVATSRVAVEGSAYVFLSYVCQVSLHVVGAVVAFAIERLAPAAEPAEVPAEIPAENLAEPESMT
ncbi:MAG: flippase-like domain-containing protein [Deltaproteobacteria bacterium]|nr:flippase-like domain-containing protein [Deltaproteobacteria bacterium]